MWAGRCELSRRGPAGALYWTAAGPSDPGPPVYWQLFTAECSGETCALKANGLTPRARVCVCLTVASPSC